MQAQARAKQMARNAVSQYYYTYSSGGPNTALAAVASGATATAQVNIQADAAFMIQALTAFAFNGTTFAEVTSPIATVQVTDTGSGTTLFDVPQMLRNVFGTASLPLFLPTERVLSPNASLLITVNNINSANALTYQFSFLGQKLYGQ